MKTTHSSNPIVERALRARNKREANRELHSSNPTVERALRTRLSEAVDDYAQKAFEAIVDPQNKEKYETAVEARARIANLEEEIKNTTTSKGSEQ